MMVKNKKRNYFLCFQQFHELYLAPLSLLQGEYDSPGDDMNDRKVSWLYAALSA